VRKSKKQTASEIWREVMAAPRVEEVDVVDEQTETEFLDDLLAFLAFYGDNVNLDDLHEILTARRLSI
jgi:hypothetical protein